APARGAGDPPGRGVGEAAGGSARLAGLARPGGGAAGADRRGRRGGLPPAHPHGRGRPSPGGAAPSLRLPGGEDAMRDGAPFAVAGRPAATRVRGSVSALRALAPALRLVLLALLVAVALVASVGLGAAGIPLGSVVEALAG